MKELIGLKNTLNIINSFTIDSMSHSIILLGKEGSGKTELCNYISEKLHINRVEININNLSEELIDNIYRNPNISLYTVDIRNIPEKKQNILLKLFEEPLSNSFIILIANSKFQLLPTILNRGFVLNTDDYSKDELLKVAQVNDIKIENKYIGTVLKTPGDILKIYSKNVNLEEIESLCETIITKMIYASFPNMLTIIDKINFKDEYDKIDLDLFLKLLYNKFVNKYIDSKDNKYLKSSKCVNDLLKKLAFDNRLMKKNITTCLLIDLWKIAREEK